MPEQRYFEKIRVGILEDALEETKAYLRTIANFGGTIQQARELAQKCLNKLEK